MPVGHRAPPWVGLVTSMTGTSGRGQARRRRRPVAACSALAAWTAGRDAPPGRC